MISFIPKSEDDLKKELADLKKKREALEEKYFLENSIANEKSKIRDMRFSGFKSFFGKLKSELKEYKKDKRSIFDDDKRA